MDRQLDPKETYLYGMLFTLAKEQIGAKQKQDSGKLGMLGKARLNSRGKEMERIILHLFEHKKEFGEYISSEILADLHYIEGDFKAWEDVGSEELEYLKDVLRQFS